MTPKFLFAATALAIATATAVPASAQWMPGPGPMMPPPVMAPAFLPPVARPMPMVMPYAAPGVVQMPGIPGGINPYGRDAWAVGAPAIGAGVTAGMSAYPLTRPFAPWAGQRVTANAGSAYRESGVGNQATRTFTGISPRDIETYGWRGGPNSEVNKVLGFLGM